jgi:hypothetical protein
MEKEIRGEGNSWQLPGHRLFSVGIMIALVEQKKNDLATSRLSIHEDG